MVASSQRVSSVLYRANWERGRLEPGDQLRGPFRNGRGSLEGRSHGNVQKNTDVRRVEGPANGWELGTEVAMGLKAGT